jgi:serine/threonine protein kinase
MSEHAFQAPSPESLAELLPQYQIEFFIAQGGMGAVYKGRQISLDRDIAIKVLPHEVGASEELRESFISEAKAMARLNHSNLLGVFDYGTVEGMPYIVMEYVSGGSLHQAAYNQAVELMQAAMIVKGICAGLSHAHEHGIVHRDIKPSNILLTQKVEPKVADFGLAHAADWDTPGLVMGTPGYTAPEVFQDPSQAGVLADIYSVGVILHQLLTGTDPAGCMEPPSQPSGSLRLDAIWRKATNVNPALRYPTVAAMAEDIDRWIAA